MHSPGGAKREKKKNEDYTVLYTRPLGAQKKKKPFRLCARGKRKRAGYKTVLVAGPVRRKKKEKKGEKDDVNYSSKWGEKKKTTKGRLCPVLKKKRKGEKEEALCLFIP